MFDFICYVFFICDSTQFSSMHAELLVRSRSAARSHASAGTRPSDSRSDWSVLFVNISLTKPRRAFSQRKKLFAIIPRITPFKDPQHFWDTLYIRCTKSAIRYMYYVCSIFSFFFYFLHIVTWP